jgi:hypothetical protein
VDGRGADIGPARFETGKQNRKHRAIARGGQNLARARDSRFRLRVLMTAWHVWFRSLRA